MKSYLLIKLGSDGQRFERGMAVDIRDADRPLGTAERPPYVGVVYTDHTVDQLQRLMQPAGTWSGVGTVEPEFTISRVRGLKIDIDALPERIPPGARGRLFRLFAGARVGKRLDKAGRANLLAASFQLYEVEAA